MSEPPWLERGERSQQRRQLAAPGDRRASLNRTRGSLFRFRAEAAETEAAPAGHPLEFVSQKKSGGAVPVGVTGSGTLGGGAAALAATAHRVGGSKPAAFQRSAMAGPVSAAMKARAAAGSVLLAGIAAA